MDERVGVRVKCAILNLDNLHAYPPCYAMRSFDKPYVHPPYAQEFVVNTLVDLNISLL
jgi:16S rRNA G966 N2-methylase RsmD